MLTPRIGLGIDVHRFVSGRPLRLGGVEFPGERGLEGHSDADVLLHAVCDALLGAARLGDIGRHFPPGDDAFKDASSLVLLKSVRELLAEAGFVPLQVDAVLMAESPRIAPHAGKMEDRIAGALGIQDAQVSVKGTTSEGMGALGRGEGIAAWAVVLIQSAGPHPRT